MRHLLISLPSPKVSIFNSMMHFLFYDPLTVAKTIIFNREGKVINLLDFFFPFSLFQNQGKKARNVI